MCSEASVKNAVKRPVRLMESVAEPDIVRLLVLTQG